MYHVERAAADMKLVKVEQTRTHAKNPKLTASLKSSTNDFL